MLRAGQYSRHLPRLISRQMFADEDLQEDGRLEKKKSRQPSDLLIRPAGFQVINRPFKGEDVDPILDQRLTREQRLVWEMNEQGFSLDQIAAHLSNPRDGVRVTASDVKIALECTKDQLGGRKPCRSKK